MSGPVYKAELRLRGHNPDVLTCIANLSNDEVFTPPNLANQMLDTLEVAWAEANEGKSIWSDPTVTFLDPFAKSGVFLREIASRLTVGLAEQIPDLVERVDHILTKQVYGIAITTLTSLLARRSVYCSKSANGRYSIVKSFDRDWGNIWFDRTEHTWVGGHVTDRLGPDGEPLVVGRTCRYCPAADRDYGRGDELETHAYSFIHTDDINARIAELFGAEMQFDVIVGNPPYQLGQSGGESVGGFAMPIYQRFITTAKQLDPRFVVMVTPSRWFAGGRGLDEFRAEMLADHRVAELVDFPDAAEVFAGADIAGGVSYFLWNRSHSAPAGVRTSMKGVLGERVERWLDEYDVFVRHNVGVRVLEKVWPTGVSGPTLADKVSPIQPFGLRTSFRGHATADGIANPIRLRSSQGISFIARGDIPRNDAWVDQWKVIVGRAYGERGSYPYWIYAAPDILGPGTACTETYLVVGRFETEAGADLLAAYLRTRFVRFLVSLRKNTQDIYSERFAFVPDLGMDREWTDELLYEKYEISEDEIAFIESVVRRVGSTDNV